MDTTTELGLDTFGDVTPAPDGTLPHDSVLTIADSCTRGSLRPETALA